MRTVIPSGRELQRNYAEGKLQSIATPEGTTQFDYYCGAKVKSITRGDESIAFTYDGSLLTILHQTGALDATLEFAYNDDLDITSITYAWGANAYTYDNDGLLIQSGDFNIERDAENGLPLAVEDGTYRQARDFNLFGEQSDAAVSVGGSAVFSWSVERDAAGRIVRKQEMLDGNAQLYEYDYDELGRLTSVTLDGQLVESYAYGANGARSLETNTLRDVADKAYAYGADHRLLSAGDTNYAHDADGFLLRKTRGAEVMEYAYASTGELRSVLLPDGRLVEYDNDAIGRRVAKRIDGAIVEKYLWLGRTRLLAVLHANGSLKYRFEYADDRTPVAMTHAGQRFYLAYDQVGSLRAVTDASGAIVKAVTYDSFGNVLEDSNPPLDLPFGFAGGLHDADTGLVRFGFRDYAPEVGRWTAKDPIGFGGGDSDLYGYCGGDPVNFTDFKGLYSATHSRLSHHVGPSGGGGGAVSGAILGGLLGWWASQDTKDDWHDAVDYDDWPLGQELFHPKNPDPNIDNHRNAEEECFSQCENELGGDPCSQGFPFTNCMKKCMKAKGFTYP